MKSSHPPRLANWIKWHPRFVPAPIWRWAVRAVDIWHDHRIMEAADYFEQQDFNLAEAEED